MGRTVPIAQEKGKEIVNEYLKLLNEKRLTLIMSLPYNDPALCKAAFEAGADVVKVHINVHHHASGTHFGRLAEERPALEEMLAHRRGPMGIVLGGSMEAVVLDAEDVRELPFSFYSVYADHIPAWVAGRIDKEKAALMAACDSACPMELIASMPGAGADVVEASVIPGDEYGQPLSFRDLMKYRAIVDATKVPVVVPTQRAIRPDEVGTLARCGVKALMIGAVVTGKTEESIISAVNAFRKAIDSIE